MTNNSYIIAESLDELYKILFWLDEKIELKRGKFKWFMIYQVDGKIKICYNKKEADKIAKESSLERDFLPPVFKYVRGDLVFIKNRSHVVYIVLDLCSIFGKPFYRLSGKTELYSEDEIAPNPDKLIKSVMYCYDADTNNFHFDIHSFGY